MAADKDELDQRAELIKELGALRLSSQIRQEHSEMESANVDNKDEMCCPLRKRRSTQTRYISL